MKDEGRHRRRRRRRGQSTVTDRALCTYFIRILYVYIRPCHAWTTRYHSANAATTAHAPLLSQVWYKRQATAHRGSDHQCPSIGQNLFCLR